MAIKTKTPKETPLEVLKLKYPGSESNRYEIALTGF